MAKRIMYVEGLDGQVELLADRIIIHRQGFLNAMKYGMNARREIPILAISEVVFKPATGLRHGEIEFVRSGRSTDEKKKNNMSAVKFKKDKNQAFDMLKEKSFELLNQYAKQK